MGQGRSSAAASAAAGMSANEFVMALAKARQARQLDVWEALWKGIANKRGPLPAEEQVTSTKGAGGGAVADGGPHGERSKAKSSSPSRGGGELEASFDSVLITEGALNVVKDAFHDDTDLDWKVSGIEKAASFFSTDLARTKLIGLDFVDAVMVLTMDRAEEEKEQNKHVSNIAYASPRRFFFCHLSRTVSMYEICRFFWRGGPRILLVIRRDLGRRGRIGEQGDYEGTFHEDDDKSPILINGESFFTQNNATATALSGGDLFFCSCEDTCGRGLVSVGSLGRGALDT